MGHIWWSLIHQCAAAHWFVKHHVRWWCWQGTWHHLKSFLIRTSAIHTDHLSRPGRDEQLFRLRPWSNFHKSISAREREREKKEEGRGRSDRVRESAAISFPLSAAVFLLWCFTQTVLQLNQTWMTLRLCFGHHSTNFFFFLAKIHLFLSLYFSLTHIHSQ